MLVRLIGIFVFLGLAIPTATSACTCSPSSPGTCPGLQPGDVVFLGTVTSATVVSPAPPAAPASDPPSAVAGQASEPGAAPVVRYRFHVDERFAGPDSHEIEVFSGGDDGDCAYRFEQGKQYLVISTPEADDQLFATICSGTRPAADARALIPQLRAMRDGQHVASVFGILRRTDPPFLSSPDDPDAPLGGISLHLRSDDDRFETATDSNGVYDFYDVHAGTYNFTARLPARMELTQKTLSGPLPPFRIPNGACYEYNVDALPTGHIHGSVLDAKGKPLPLASLELYRAGTYSDQRPGLWGFQGARGVFDFDHIGPGNYILVFNRTNRMAPDSPYPRAFYPGVSDLSGAKPIHLKDGEDLLHVNVKLTGAFPTRTFRVHLKWTGPKPLGTVTVQAKADRGDNPGARKVAEDLYEFTFLESANYTISASETLVPRRQAPLRGVVACPLEPRIASTAAGVSGSDSTAKEVTLIFSKPACAQQ
jgi:hypothetical protein